MRIASYFLTACVLALAAHIILVSFYPGAVAALYPRAISRVYSKAPRTTSNRVAWARLEPAAGRPGIKKVILRRKAIERLGLETALVAEKRIHRIRTIASKVLAVSDFPGHMRSSSSGGSSILVRVPLSGKADTPAADASATVRPLLGAKTSSGQTAASVRAMPIGIIAEPGKLADKRYAYYLITDNTMLLSPGTLVNVDLPLKETETVRKFVPASAVLYDPRGQAWAYTNPKPMAYVREQLNIDFMNDKVAVLRSGPPIGTKVVTTGAFELFGTESGIGQ